MSDLGNKIKTVRESRELTQEQLAAEIKRLYPHIRITQQTIDLIERGKTMHPRFVVEIAVALDVNPKWLVDTTGTEAQHIVDLATLNEPQRSILASTKTMPYDNQVTTARFLHTHTESKPYGGDKENGGRRKPKRQHSG